MQEPNKISRNDNKTDQNMSEHSLDTNTDTTVHKYQDDKDFNEAYKNLLDSVEPIIKRISFDPLQYNFIKELDSYLNHLKGICDSDASVFVEAALMIQNVIIIYQKRVDQFIDLMMNLITKFRLYRRNLYNNKIDSVKIEVKKKKEVKLSPYFQQFKFKLDGPLKTFDYNLIDQNKKLSVPKIVLNTMIKVDNKFNELSSYIKSENGESIGKKYNFLLNSSLNCDMALNEGFDCCVNEESDASFHNCLSYQTNNVPSPMYMEDDEINHDDEVPATHVVFEQTVHDVMAQHAAVLSSENLINTSQIPQITDDSAWNSVENDNAYSNKPIIEKRYRKNEYQGILPPISGLYGQMIKLKSDIDSEFRKIVYGVQKSQRLLIEKKRTEHVKDCDINMNDELKNTEELGFRGFDNNDFDCNFDFEDNEQPVEDNADAFQAYHNNEIDMQKHEQNQLEIVNEQLEMRKKVQNWHDNLKPILEAEEKRTEFDVHEYGTRVLNCFKEIGEQKLFKELVGGLEKEEVARFFLSTLIMTNTSNVKIINSQAHDGDMKIELLNKERHHEQLQVSISNQIYSDLDK